MKLRHLVILIILLSGLALGSEPPGDAPDPLKKRIVDMVTRGFPFKRSKDYTDKRYREHLNNFFNEAIYDRLEGNHFIGFIYNDKLTLPRTEPGKLNTAIYCGTYRETFRPIADTFNANLRRVLTSARPVSFESFKESIKTGVENDNTVYLGMVIVSVEPEKTAYTMAGMVCELAVHFRGRAFYKRFYSGKNTLDAAILDAVNNTIITIRALMPADGEKPRTTKER